ncbi:MAG TPA: GNAT family N-acetyltransferase [Ktedonobacterales bacterium]
MRVRLATRDDHDEVVALLVRGGWSHNRKSYAFYLRYAQCAPFVVEDGGGAIVGTGVATQYGVTGWLGQILVAAEARGQGVGTLITRTLMAHLQKHGCRSLLLAASEFGRPIYEKLGFVEDGTYHLLQKTRAAGSDVAPPALAASRIRRIVADDLDAICALDAVATGEDRAELLRAFGPDGWVIPDAGGGEERVGGYAIRSAWGPYGVVATNARTARLLVEHASAVDGADDMTTWLHSANVAGRAAFEAAGYTDVRSVMRMVYGQPVVWHPELVWRLFALGIG